jgi:ribosomal protein S18 acetylase RimI-like enzyme
MVSENARRKGIGKAMASFSLIEAKRLGFRERQFNLVVKTNKKAIHLWLKMGFSIIGEIPEAYKHSSVGFVNAYIMHQKL